MKRVAYLSGAMRGKPYYNFPAFDDAQKTLELANYVVISPAQMDREHGFDAMKCPADTDWNAIPEGFDFQACVARDINAIWQCDVIYMLEGWEMSTGAKAELAIAKWLGKEVVYDDESGDSFVEPVVEDKTAKLTNPKDAIGARKAKFSTIPAGVMFDVGLAMLEGAVKYGRHNYRGVGVRSSVYYDAAMGHTADWWEGQDVDPDSGLHHITKAIASLVVLRDAILQDKLTDDRPPCSKVFKRDFNAEAARLIDMHNDKNPKHWTIADKEF